MRALLCRSWGAVEGLELGEATPPVPGSGQVLIDVIATSANYADSIMVAGSYQTRPDLPFSPGLEAAGTVAAVGADAGGFAPGDPVMALLAHGGFAEQAVAEAGETWPLFEGMRYADGAVFPVAYLSAHVALRWQARLEAGETLLVLGAAGGAGLAAVEIGKGLGARVIAGASGDDRLALARDHGADETVNYRTEALADRVKALTGGAGADVCFDPIGGDLFDAALSSLGWGGRHVHFGFVGGVPKVAANRLLVKHRAALGSSLRYYRWHRPDLLARTVTELGELWGAGRLRPRIACTLPLERGVEALELLTGRRATGKVVVEVRPGTAEARPGPPGG